MAGDAGQPERDAMKYKPVSHDHRKFLKNARKREGFRKAYDAMEEDLITEEAI